MTLLSRYAAAWVLMSLALFFNLMHYRLEVHVAPATGTMAYWLTTTVENLQSEVWQIALAAFVFQHFMWLGSPEAQDQAGNDPQWVLVPVAVMVIFAWLFAVAV